MSVFITLLVIGLAGLVFMAIPAFGHHAQIGHGASHAGHIAPHAGHAPTTAPHTHTVPAPHGQQGDAGTGAFLGLLPSPRTLFSLLTFYGAFGNLFQQYFHLTMGISALLATLPAYLIERCVATPLWNLLIGFAAEPAQPMQSLLLKEAEAVSHFTNGKGMVKVIHDEREVQFLAQLSPEQANIPISVGTKLRIEEVNTEKERLTVRLE